MALEMWRPTSSKNVRKLESSRLRGFTPASTNPTGSLWPGVEIGSTTPESTLVSQAPRGSGPSRSARLSIAVMRGLLTASLSADGKDGTRRLCCATADPGSEPQQPCSVAEAPSASNRYNDANGMQ